MTDTAFYYQAMGMNSGQIGRLVPFRFPPKFLGRGATPTVPTTLRSTRHGSPGSVRRPNVPSFDLPAGSVQVHQDAATSSSETPTEEWLQLTGALTAGYRLNTPIQVHVWSMDGEYVVSASDLLVTAFGPDRDEALKSLREAIVEQRERLDELDGRLSQRMLDLFRILQATVVR